MQKIVNEKQSYIEEVRDNYVKREDEGAVSSLSSIYELKTDRMVNMSEIAQNMRNAFLVTLILSALLFITSSIAEHTLGLRIILPFDERLLHLVLATGAVVYGGAYFFRMTAAALRRGTTDATTLTSVAVVVLFAYSIATTFLIPGPSFYYATTVVLTFALLVQWFKFSTWDEIKRSTRSPLNEIPEGAVEERTEESSALTRLVNLTEVAQNTVPQQQRFIESAVSYIAPIAILASLLVFMIWGITTTKSLAFAFIVAIAMITIIGAETFMLSAPFAIALGIEFASRRGVLIRDAETVERTARVNVVVFDEIDTLIEGTSRVSDVYHVGILTEPGFIRLAASLGRAAKHQFAEAIISAAHQDVGRAIPNPEEYGVVPGCGAIGKIETRTVYLGNRRLMADKGINIYPVEAKAEEFAGQGKSVVFVAVDNRIEGIIAVPHTVKPEVKEAIEKLHDAGISVALLTRDTPTTATTIGQEIGIDEVHADVWPGAKAEKIRELQSPGRMVVAVTNNIDDTPLLGQADISIVVGVGANLSREHGDVMIIEDRVLDAVMVLGLGKLVERKVKQNVYWAVAYNLAAPLIAAGIFYSNLGLLVRPETAAAIAAISASVTIFNSASLRNQMLKRLS